MEDLNNVSYVEALLKGEKTGEEMRPTENKEMWRSHR